VDEQGPTGQTSFGGYLRCIGSIESAVTVDRLDPGSGRGTDDVGSKRCGPVGHRITGPVESIMSERPYRVLLSAALLGLFPLLATAQTTDTLHLESGLLAGVRGTDPGVRVYKGIPYAAPPVGDLRWRSPQPAHPWEGVRKADEFAPGCIQDLARSRPPWTEEFMHQGGVSEDCLYLNVWTTAEDAVARHPVLVYLHGGGFGEGSGSVAVYDGDALARKGLVVVTVNYRLGVLGFLAHPELTAESEHAASGNYGLLDQVAALRWVRDNVAVFGGDPDNVTIAGQSAGAIAVYLLTASPIATGLFHRAIVESGPGGLAAFGLTSSSALARPLSEAEAGGSEFAPVKGAASLAKLRAMSPAELIAGAAPMRFGPVIDGYFLPRDVATIYAEGAQNDVPLLTGFNADEGSAFPGYGKATVDGFRKLATERYGESADAFLALYRAATDDEAGDALKASLRDAAAVALERLAAERARTAKTDAYLYYFERAIPWPEHPEFGAFHTGEVPYVFDNLRRLDRPWEAVDRQLADAVSWYWVNFATRGDPNGDGLPAWPTFRAAPRALMALGERLGPRDMPADQVRRAFFEARFGNGQ
jgi:para-nitrobenzyl esterase